MELKYKENRLWKIMAIAWSAVTLINVGVMLFLLKGSDNLLMSPVQIVTILLSISLAFYFYKLKTIDYLRINNQQLSVHKGLVIPRKKINIKEIKQGQIGKDKLTLIQHNGKKTEIHLHLLSIQDYEKLRNKLSKYFVIR